MVLHRNLDKLSAVGSTSTSGSNIVFDRQPSYNPDLIKLDLCFFYNLQQAANKHKGTSEILKKLVCAVAASYQNYSVDNYIVYMP